MITDLLIKYHRNTPEPDEGVDLIIKYLDFYSFYPDNLIDLADFIKTNKDKKGLKKLKEYIKLNNKL